MPMSIRYSSTRRIPWVRCSRKRNCTMRIGWSMRIGARSRGLGAGELEGGGNGVGHESIDVGDEIQCVRVEFVDSADADNNFAGASVRVRDASFRYRCRSRNADVMPGGDLALLVGEVGVANRGNQAPVPLHGAALPAGDDQVESGELDSGDPQCGEQVSPAASYDDIASESVAELSREQRERYNADCHRHQRWARATPGRAACRVHGCLSIQVCQ